MARSRETKIELTAYDDLFQTDESREEAKLSKIRDIPISEIDEFPDHPFKVLMDEDMEQLVESIKRNGVKNKDPNAEVDVIARAEGASKISRIVERFNLASVDTASIVTEAEKSKDAKDGQPEPDIGVQEKAEKDKLLDELMGKPVQKEENAPNPSVAKTEKSPQSEPTSEQPKKSAEGATMTKEKPSVREELRKIKESRKEQEAEIGTSDLDKSGASDRAKSANRKTEHKQPPRKKKKPKSKETR